MVIEYGAADKDIMTANVLAFATTTLGGDGSKKRAILTGNGIVLNDVAKLLQQQQLEIGQTIGLGSYDNWPWMDVIGPGITVMEVPAYGLGKRSAERLLQRIQRNDNDITHAVDNQTAYISRVGNAPFGQHILDFLQEQGISTDYITLDEINRTGMQLKAKTLAGDPEVVNFRRYTAFSYMESSIVDTVDWSVYDHLHVTGIPAALSASCRDTIEAILTLSEKYKENADVVIGAGTVLDAETARLAIVNGAAFVVSPAFDEATIKLCNRYRVACMPGTTTIQGVIQALELGADIVKVFPGEVVGSKFIKAVKGPLPQAQMMPTGGVSIDNVAEWFKAGAVAVGAGGALTGGGKSLAEITETAKKFVAAVAAARA